MGDTGSADDTRTVTWSLIFDAGSSGTRLFLFKVKRGIGLPDDFEEFAVPNKQDEELLDVRPGISGHFKNKQLSKLGDDIESMLSVAKKYVPLEKYKTTTVKFGATAGMRLFSSVEQNEMLGAARIFLANKTINPFAAADVFMLSGEEEGVFGWLAVNYFLKKFNETGANKDHV